MKAFRATLGIGWVADWWELRVLTEDPLLEELKPEESFDFESASAGELTRPIIRDPGNYDQQRKKPVDHIEQEERGAGSSIESC